MSVEQLLVVAILVEAILESLKPIWDVEKRGNLIEFYVSLGLGIAVALLGGVNFFETLEVPLNFWPALGAYPGIVLSGVVLGRGSNFIHDLITKIKS